MLYVLFIPKRMCATSLSISSPPLSKALWCSRFISNSSSRIFLRLGTRRGSDLHQPQSLREALLRLRADANSDRGRYPLSLGQSTARASRARSAGGQRQKAQAHLRQRTQERQARRPEPGPSGAPGSPPALSAQTPRRGRPGSPGTHPLARGTHRSEGQAHQSCPRNSQVVWSSVAQVLLTHLPQEGWWVCARALEAGPRTLARDHRLYDGPHPRVRLRAGDHGERTLPGDEPPEGGPRGRDAHGLGVRRSEEHTSE